MYYYYPPPLHLNIASPSPSQYCCPLPISILRGPSPSHIVAPLPISILLPPPHLILLPPSPSQYCCPSPSQYCGGGGGGGGGGSHLILLPPSPSQYFLIANPLPLFHTLLRRMKQAVPLSAGRSPSVGRHTQKQRKQRRHRLKLTVIIPYYIIHNKNDWLKSVGYIAA